MSSIELTHPFGLTEESTIRIREDDVLSAAFPPGAVREEEDQEVQGLGKLPSTFPDVSRLRSFPVVSRCPGYRNNFNTAFRALATSQTFGLGSIPNYFEGSIPNYFEGSIL